MERKSKDLSKDLHCVGNIPTVFDERKTTEGHRGVPVLNGNRVAPGCVERLLTSMIDVDCSGKKRCKTACHIIFVPKRPLQENDRTNLFLFRLSLHFAFLFNRCAVPFKRVVYLILFLVVSSRFLMAESYVFRSEDERQSHLHKALFGRQRRDVQREILSILGLNHRPRLHAPRPIETSSAPLYMLGLYSSASLDQDQDPALDLSRIAKSNGDGRRNPREGVQNQRLSTLSSRHFRVDPRDRVISSQSNVKLRKYIEDSGILTNEIGILESRKSGNQGSGNLINNSRDLETERILTEQSDMIISFINTKQHQVLNEYSAPLMDPHTMLRRHRNFYFDISQISQDDRLAAARFRLYKEKSDVTIGNVTLRLHVYQVVTGYDGRPTVRHLGSRLAGSHQEGWLVFDVTNALSDWISRPRGNLGLKVTVETLEGRFLKPTKTGLVGRRGSATKQAFVVAFFNQGKPDLLRPNIRRRFRRSADFSFDVSINRTESDSMQRQENDEDYNNNEDNNDDDDDDENTDNEEENELSSTTTSTRNDGEIHSRTMTKRKTKSRKRGRKRKKFPKNSSKRKQTLEPCQRKQFYVDFKDLGWHTWIIAPKAYKAYHCYGKCSFPLNAGLNVTNHAIVQSLVHVRLKSLNIPEPCCAPSKLEPLEILFFNDQTKVIYKKYRDMVVSACGCH